MLRVKTPIHLFTYSLFSTPNTKSKQYQSSVLEVVWCMMPTTLSESLPFCSLEIKSKKWTTFPCSELKSLFTYSPIHFSPHCLEIKPKTKNFLLLRVKTPIHLFTYSPFTFILSFDNFRRAEPKRRCSLHIHQNWAYATKRRHCCMNHSVAVCTRDCLEIKRKTEIFFLLRVKTTIHLFTYSLFRPLVWK